MTSVILQGKIYRSAHSKKTNKGTPVALFVVLSESNGEINFFNVVATGNLYQSTMKNAIEGRMVKIVGELRQNSPVSNTRVVALSIEYDDYSEKYYWHNIIYVV